MSNNILENIKEYFKEQQERDKLSESEKLLWDIKHSDSSTVYLSKEALELKEYLKNLDKK
jgi:hypothetical protein